MESLRFIIVTKHRVCGVAFVAQEMAEMLLSAGAAVHVFSRRTEGLRDNLDSICPVFDAPEPGSEMSLWQRAVEEVNPTDVIFIEPRNLRSCDDFAMAAHARTAGARVFAFVNIDNVISSEVKPLAKFHRLICPTQFTAALLAEHGLGERCAHVDWFIDTDYWTPAESDPLWLWHGAGNGGFLFRKNTPLVVAAFAKVHRIAPRARLRIHSQRPLREYPAAMRRTVAECAGIEAHFGTVARDDLRDMARRCALHVYPTRFEGHSLTIPECMAMGMATVTPDHPPMNELITPEVGALIPCHPARRAGQYIATEAIVAERDLTAAILRAISDLPTLMSMGERARVRAVEQFSCRAATERFLAAVLGADS